MPGQLFTTYFLEESIARTEAWQEALSDPSELESFRAQALALLDKAAVFHSINEASTEQELIRPLLELLDWTDFLPQQGSDSNEDIPDHLLFGDAESPSQEHWPRDSRIWFHASQRKHGAWKPQLLRRFSLPTLFSWPWPFGRQPRSLFR